jgi:hypothetical protein
MANSKLLKEAIADAKAVKETALANAKLALEEAFTPRLQSILSQKLQAEAEMEDEEKDETNEELSSTGIGSKVDAGYAETPGSQPTLDANTDLSVGVKKDAGKPEQAGTDYKKVADISEEENPFADDAAGDDKDAKIAELESRIAELEGGNDSEEMHDEPDMDNMGGESDMDADNADMGDDSMDMDSSDEESEDDMELEAIIKQLEAQLGADDEETPAEEPSMDEAMEDEKSDMDEAKEDEKSDMDEAKEDDKEEMDEVIDLEEILREMEADLTNEAEESKEDEKEEELKEAYSTIKSLQKTINEVNLLNAKLLFANKLFRAHNMTNEQKVKVIETLDRTNSVREVKLVYSTLAENFKYTSISKTAKKSITEGIASKVVKSTAPKTEVKQVIAESADFSDRFKKLAGIIK